MGSVAALARDVAALVLTIRSGPTAWMEALAVCVGAVQVLSLMEQPECRWKIMLRKVLFPAATYRLRANVANAPACWRARARARVRACVSANITAVKRFQSVSAHVAKRRALLNEYCSM